MTKKNLCLFSRACAKQVADGSIIGFAAICLAYNSLWQQYLPFKNVSKDRLSLVNALVKDLVKTLVEAFVKALVDAYAEVDTLANALVCAWVRALLDVLINALVEVSILDQTHRTSGPSCS